jgi:hypothetical protein
MRVYSVTAPPATQLPKGLIIIWHHPSIIALGREMPGTRGSSPVLLSADYESRW